MVVGRPTSVLRGFPLLLFFILGYLCVEVPTVPQCKTPLKSSQRTVATEVPKTKLFLMASPKAGVQLTWRLTIDHMNRTAQALQLPNFPFEWKSKIFPKEFDVRSVKEVKERLSEGYKAIALVRNPLDRAISSYVHVMSTKLVTMWLELNDQLKTATAPCVHRRPECAKNATFVEFEDALTHYAYDGGQYPGEGHMISQSQFFQLFPEPEVTIIPVEMMVPAGADDYCPPLDHFVKVMNPFRVSEREEAIHDMLTNHSGPHVKRQYKADLQDMDMNPDADSSHIPFTELHEAIEAGHFPKYDSFFRDKELCRHVVGCLYARDVAQYLRVCRQPQFRECSFFQKTCREQIRRLREVCGLEDLVEEFGQRN